MAIYRYSQVGLDGKLSGSLLTSKDLLLLRGPQKMPFSGESGGRSRSFI